MPPRIDMAGKRCGCLTVLREDGTLWGRVAWLCRCDCGGYSTVDGTSLRNGNTGSCGCRERLTHGHRRLDDTHPLYSTWKSMRQRCSNANNDNYKYYGERGIAVCARWENSFAAFLADVGERPSPRLTIDRINNDGNYEPGNTRWDTRRQQVQNRRKKP